MPDREKIIKDLEFCVNGHFKVELSLATKILALLKEQEPKPVYYETNSMTGLPIAHCPSCKEVIKQYAYGDIRKTYYCQYCGQAVKWECLVLG